MPLFVVCLDPFGIGLHEAFQEFSGAVIDQFAARIEQFVGAADISLRLRHRRDVQKHERLTQMMIGSEPPMPPGDAETTAPGFPLHALWP